MCRLVATTKRSGDVTTWLEVILTNEEQSASWLICKLYQFGTGSSPSLQPPTPLLSASLVNPTHVPFRHGTLPHNDTDYGIYHHVLSKTNLTDFLCVSVHVRLLNTGSLSNLCERRERQCCSCPAGSERTMRQEVFLSAVAPTHTSPC